MVSGNPGRRARSRLAEPMLMNLCFKNSRCQMVRTSGYGWRVTSALTTLQQDEIIVQPSTIAQPLVMLSAIKIPGK